MILQTRLIENDGSGPPSNLAMTEGAVLIVDSEGAYDVGDVGDYDWSLEGHRPIRFWAFLPRLTPEAVNSLPPRTDLVTLGSLPHLHPIEDRVFVRTQKVAEKQLDSGVILTEGVQERELHGEVVAVGPGRYAPKTGLFIPMALQPGDHVTYTGWGAHEVEYNGEKLWCMTQKEVTAITRFATER